MLNGRKSGDQQNLHTFLVNNAKCDENFNPENIYQIQINYLSNLFKTKIQPLIGNQEQSSDFDQCSNDFHDRCQQVLFNTLSILLELKSVLNEKKNTKSLHDKMKLILSNKTLFNNNTLNNSDQNQIDFHYNNYILDHQSRLLAMRNCSVSLVKLDEEIVKLYSSKKVVINYKFYLFYNNDKHYSIVKLGFHGAWRGVVLLGTVHALWDRCRLVSIRKLSVFDTRVKGIHLRLLLGS